MSRLQRIVIIKNVGREFGTMIFMEPLLNRIAAILQRFIPTGKMRLVTLP